jgi:predicted PurR-regulated permease PerM
MLEKPFTYDRTIRLLLAIGFVVGFVWLINRLSSVLLPFVIALLLAYLLDPVVSFIQKGVKNKRGIALFITFAIILLLHVGFYALLIPSVINEYEHFRDIFINNKEYLLNGKFIPEIIRTRISNLAESIDIFSPENFSGILNKALPGIWSSFTGIMSILFSFLSFVIVYLYLVFLLLDYRKFKEKWHTYLPEQTREKALEFIDELNFNLVGYFRQKTVIVLILMVLFSVSFNIIGLPLATILGIMIAIMNYVPYLQIIGIIPCMLSAGLLSFDTSTPFWIYALILIAVFAIIQLIEDGLLVPYFMKKVTGLNPALMLLSITVWGSLMGALGMIIALPITTLIITYYKKYVLKIDSRRSIVLVFLAII